jgi:hypothetical protein
MILQHRQRAITSIADEHVPRGVRQGEPRFRLHHHCLWGNAAGPKHRHFSWGHGDRIAEVRALQVTNAQSCGVTYMHGGSVHGWKATGDLHGAHDIIYWQRAHTDYQRTVEHTGGFARTIGNEHGNIHAQFDVPHAHTGIHEGVFEGKTTPQEETDEIVSPVGFEIVDLRDEYTIPIHTITWNVRTDIGAWCEFPRFGITRVEHFKEWAGLGVPLAEEQKIIGQGSRHYCQVGLCIAWCQAGSWMAPLAGTNTLPYLVRRQTSQVVPGMYHRCHKTFLMCAKSNSRTLVWR